jgi:hypothetical protein
MGPYEIMNRIPPGALESSDDDEMWTRVDVGLLDSLVQTNRDDTTRSLTRSLLGAQTPGVRSFAWRWRET